MKADTLSIASLALLLFAACASSDGFADQDVRQCGPGADIEINAGWDPAGAPRAERLDSRIVFVVEVANNSHGEVTVTRISADPSSANREGLYQLQGGSRTFDKVIPEGEASTFEIPMSGAYGGSRFESPTRQERFIGADVYVTVHLSGGDSYRCQFRVPVPA